MYRFYEWLLKEDVRHEKQAFIQLVKQFFPQANIEDQNGETAVDALAANRRIIMAWVPGLDYFADAGDETQEKHSYVNISFYHTTNQSDDEYQDYVGRIKKTGVTPASINFTKLMLGFVKGLRQSGINIWFDAVGMDRADAYAGILQKAGYTLGTYKGVRQLWLASPIHGVNPSKNPYKDMSSGALRRQRRELMPANNNSGIQLRF